MTPSSTRMQPSGVLDAAGRFVEQSISWNNSTSPVNEPPTVPPEAEISDLDGRYLFGGIFYGHFGHFIVESLSRIWALDSLDAKADGLIFTPKTPRITEHHVGHYSALLAAFGVDLPIRIAHGPTRVSDLHVPLQGFGMYDLIDGSPAFRDFINRHAGKTIAPEGPERLYVSRSQLPPQRGSILGEHRIEEYLAAEGYEVFHPQRASHAEQIARYRAARFVIGTDCSPLHLLGYVGDSGQRVGVLTRRSMEIGSYLVRQLQVFKQMQAVEINCLVNDWMPQPGTRPSRSSWGEADFPRMHAALLEAGLISNATPWPALSRADRDAEIQRLEESHATSFKPFNPEA
ncbi:glycosyltransferase family 61 protein [Paracoccus spongiarum]|uniref:Glycosyltransferase 61 family protein n=1 Tax=Paracoccus spongiarum TaxID=3064387 RepID=A0ABT9JCT1_9RHOB|nr:glycosyltransferase 61 family protein [Paracoccus sp. 2205BS29-5]MDP5306916.1 glycosyltransferase 61 family protein [Paracoccus sp. 2205BS29-5]